MAEKVILEQNEFDKLSNHLDNGEFDKGVNMSDGNGRTIILKASTSTRVQWLTIILLFLIQVAAIGTMWIRTVDQAKLVPEISKQLTSLDTSVSLIRQEVAGFKGLKEKLDDTMRNVAIVDTQISSLPEINTDVSTALKVLGDHGTELEAIRRQIERITAEQDAIRNTLQDRTKDQFYESDWLREKEVIKQQQQAELRYLEAKFETIEQKIEALKK